MKNYAILLTAYEKYGKVGEYEYLKMFMDEEIFPSVDMISDYNEYLINKGYEPFEDDLEMMLQGLDVIEIVRCTQYGHHFNMMDDYFQFNGYGNIESFDEWKVLDEMQQDTDFLAWYIDENNLIDWDEAEEVINEANELIRKGF